ncbi:MAG: recombinase family protein [Lachnospiraceae bacterium]|nr:recombinase family protein [Lachnospiraceae bacterium]
MEVNRSWIPRNEYTTPLKGAPDYCNSGIIKAVAGKDKIQVGRIDYEHYDTEDYQYIITPFWEIIDTLPTNIFQGIPGIDMELRLERYYRVNMEPVFITERTPGKNRVDLWELLDSVGLTYYDRLEWLIRTDLRAAVDNLIVERARNDTIELEVHSPQEAMEAVKTCQRGDRVTIVSLEVLGKSSQKMTDMLRQFCYTGIQLRVSEQNMEIKGEDYRTLVPILSCQLKQMKEHCKEAQAQGIENAKEEGKYKGRKRLAVDKQQLLELYSQVQTGKISLEEALRITGLSRSTFYRRVKEYRK